MKRQFTFFVMMMLVMAGIFAEDPVFGMWKNIDDDNGEIAAVWNFYEEDGQLFGDILAMRNRPQNALASDCKASYKDFPKAGKVNKMPVVGTSWIYNLTKESEGNWKGGYIIDPSTGKQYGCMIKHLKVGEKNKSFTAVEETLAVAISVGPVKVFKYWVKATEDDIVYLQKKFPAE